MTMTFSSSPMIQALIFSDDTCSIRAVIRARPSCSEHVLPVRLVRRPYYHRSLPTTGAGALRRYGRRSGRGDRSVCALPGFSPAPAPPLEAAAENPWQVNGDPVAGPQAGGRVVGEHVRAGNRRGAVDHGGAA